LACVNLTTMHCGKSQFN